MFTVLGMGTVDEVEVVTLEVEPASAKPTMPTAAITIITTITIATAVAIPLIFSRG